MEIERRLIRRICYAYEQGYGTAQYPSSYIQMNPYSDNTEEAFAWDYGFETGREKSKKVWEAEAKGDDTIGD